MTFAVTNTDKQDFHDFNVDLHTLGGGGGIVQGKRIAPGQTTQMTVKFPLKGNVYYYCREPEHTEFGEAGYLVIR